MKIYLCTGVSGVGKTEFCKRTCLPILKSPIRAISRQQGITSEIDLKEFNQYDLRKLQILYFETYMRALKEHLAKGETFIAERSPFDFLTYQQLKNLAIDDADWQSAFDFMKRYQPTLLYFPYPPYWTEAQVDTSSTSDEQQDDWEDDDTDPGAPAPDDDGYRDTDYLKNTKWDALLQKATRPYAPTLVTSSLDPASLR